MCTLLFRNCIFYVLEIFCTITYSCNLLSCLRSSLYRMAEFKRGCTGYKYEHRSVHSLDRPVPIVTDSANEDSHVDMISIQK